MYKVSIIIPIYGVEKYIERCAHSLFQQTLDNIQYIFVDDCTKDNSITLLKEVIKNYPQRNDDIIIVRTPQNSGLPQARKLGLKYAKGDYIIHCDSDDWVELDMYEQLYRKAIDEDLDIVTCDYYVSHTNSDILYLSKGNTKTNKVFLSDVISQKISNSVWNKLVKRSLYKNPLIHPVQNMGEDMVLILQIILRANKIGHISKPLYHYFFNSISISKEISDDAILKKWHAINENIQIIQDILQKNNLLHEYKKEIITLKEKSRHFILKPLINKSHIRNLWISSYPDINLSFSNSFKNNIIYILVYLRIYPLYLNIKSFILN